jgi:hypothetical protein
MIYDEKFCRSCVFNKTINNSDLDRVGWSLFSQASSHRMSHRMTWP